MILFFSLLVLALGLAWVQSDLLGQERKIPSVKLSPAVAEKLLFFSALVSWLELRLASSDSPWRGDHFGMLRTFPAITGNSVCSFEVLSSGPSRSEE